MWRSAPGAPFQKAPPRARFFDTWRRVRVELVVHVTGRGVRGHGAHKAGGTPTHPGRAVSGLRWAPHPIVPHIQTPSHSYGEI